MNVTAAQVFVAVFTLVATLEQALALMPETEIAFVPRDVPTITRAIDVVIDNSPKQVTIGDDVVFTQRISPMASSIRREGFQVRIFSLAAPDSMPVQARYIDGCLIFFSTVYSVSGSENPKINVVTDVSAGWLTLADDRRRIAEGYYLMVFERSSSREPVFRILSTDADMYFKTGIRLIVRDNGRESLQNVVDAYAQREAGRDKLNEYLEINNDKTACYHYVKYPLAKSNNDLALFAVPCANSDRLEIGRPADIYN